MHDIDSALEVIRARDAGAARLATGLWGAMRTGAAHPRVTRYDVQGVCWGALPLLVRSSDGRTLVGDRYAAAAVLGELLELLGYPRYAEICRGAVTRRILAVAEDADTCTALADAAWRCSGVEPPDTPVLTWGVVRGPLEQTVHAGAGRILEEAIEGGLVDLTRADAQQQRIGLMMRLLASPAEGMAGTWFAQVFAERLDSWLVAGGSQLRRELLVRIRPEVAHLPELGVRDPFPALRLLLGACRPDGVRLTRSGYLPTALVADLIELMPACEGYPRGRSESVWPPLLGLRALAAELGLVRGDGTRLRLTPLGEDRVDDGDSLVMSVGEGLVTRDATARGVIQEVVFAVLLLEERAEVDRLLEKVAVVIDEEGWSRAAGGPPARQLSLDFARLFLRRLQLLDALRVGEDIGLTDAGRVAARWALRARVMLREVPA